LRKVLLMIPTRRFSTYKVYRILSVVIAAWMIVSLACAAPQYIPFLAPTPTETNTPLPPTPTATLFPSPTPIPPLPPVVIETQPMEGGEIPQSGPLTIVFDQAMERTSVEAVLLSQIPVKFEWMDDASVKVSFNQPLKPGSELKISITQDVRSVAGLAFGTPVELGFYVADPLKVTERLPQPDAIDISPGSAIVASFNSPIVTLTAESGKQPVGLTIQPAVPGHGEWLNTSTYIYYPNPAMQGGQRYTVEVNPQLVASNGSKLTEDETNPLSWTFTTALPRLVQFTPGGDKLERLDTAVQLTFNQPMDTSSVESNFILQNSNTVAVQGKFEWNDDLTQMTYRAGGLLNRNTIYTMILLGTATSQGGAKLGGDFYQNFATAPDFAVVNIRPSGETNLFSAGWGNIIIEFSAPLAEQDLENFISLTPALQGARFYQYPDSGTVSISGVFEAGTRYVLTVSDKLHDVWEGVLGITYQGQFKTQPAEALVSIPALRTVNHSIFIPLGERTIPIQVTNVNTLTVNQNTIQVQDFIQLMGEQYGNTKGGNLKDIFQTPPEGTWQQAIYPPPNRIKDVDLWLTQSAKALSPGLYYYSLSIPAITNQWNLPDGFLVVVSKYQFTMKNNSDQLLVWVVNLEDNTTAADLELVLYDDKGVPIGVEKTDAKGLCQFTGVKLNGVNTARFVVSGNPGEENFGFGMTHWNNQVNGWTFGYNSELGTKKEKLYLYTDRPIYQPGQTVFFRAIVKDEYNGRYTPSQIKQLTFRLYGGYSELLGQRPQYGELISAISVYGSAYGSFKIPQSAEPGTFGLQVVEVNQEITVTVANYRKPEIEVFVSFEKQDFRLGADVKATVKTSYYFGAPAGDVSVRWSLGKTDSHFFIGNGYQTGKVNLDWVNPRGFSYYGFDGFIVLSGQGKTKPDGTLEITIPADTLAKHLTPDEIQSLILDVSVEDESGFVVSGEAQARIHPADFYIGIRPGAWSVATGQEIGFDIQTVDWQAAPSSNHNLSGFFKRVTWKRSDQADVGGVYNLIPEYYQTGSVDFITDGNARARLAFIPLEPGMYILGVNGEGAIAEVTVWVGGKGQASWPTNPDQHIRLEVDNSTVKPGETVKVFIPNPFIGGAQALITVERDEVMRMEVIQIREASYVYNLVTSDEDAPNVYVSALLLGKRADGRPDFRMGYTMVVVEPFNETLNVSLTPQPDRGAPAAEQRYSILVTNSQGKPIQGEFSLGIVDKAVLALADPNAQDIMEAFYGQQELGIFNSLSLAVYGGRFIPAYPGLGGGGGGDGSVLSIREDFKDTAYWNASIQTDAQGKAEISFILPDNLTTWVANMRGMTANTMVGEATNELVVSKDLLIRPVTPRFLVAGDHIRLGAMVHNNTTQEMTVEVSIQVKGFTLDEEGMTVQEVTLAANSRQRVDWWGLVQDVNGVDLIFSAQGGGLNDAARPEMGVIPVKAYSVPQSFATAGVMTEGGEKLEVIALPNSFAPVGGELSVELSPSLTAAILKSLSALEDFPMEWTEGILSRLLPNLETYILLQKTGTEDPELKSRLDRYINSSVMQLLAMQNSDGGWGWANGQSSDTYITAYALLGLYRASENGAEINPEKLTLARNNLVGSLYYPDQNMGGWFLDRQVFIYYVLQQTGMKEVDPTALFDFRDQLSPWAKAMLALILNAGDATKSEANVLLSDLQTSAVRSASGAHWEKDVNQANYGSANYNTALVLMALVEMKPDSPLVTESTRYLMAHRRNNGCWASSYESAWVILALNNVIQATGDLKSTFTFSASLNGAPLLSGQAGSTTLTPVSAVVPLSGLYATGSNALRIQRDGGDGVLYYRSYLKINRPAETAQAILRGLNIERSYIAPGQDCRKSACASINSYKLDESSPAITVRLTLTLNTAMQYLVVEDYIPAGMEIVDLSLKTNQGASSNYNAINPFEFGWNWWLFGSPQIYDDHIRWVAPDLQAGTYELTYKVQPILAGDFKVLPAHAYEYYFPEVEGSNAGMIFTIVP
jgi:uncharacterized protein YfaS (alpha-2-macroglobulin family)